MTSPVSPDEAARMEALDVYQIMDTPAEQAYDDVVKLAAAICDVPIAMVSLLDTERQWVKARVGLEVSQIPIQDAFCSHAIASEMEVMEVRDMANDPRFANHAFVIGEPGIRFYAGAPLVTPSGVKLGTVCVIDRVPRALDSRSKAALLALSRQVVSLLELRHTEAKLRSMAVTQQLRQLQLEGYQKQLESVNELLRQQAMLDPLTGLNNRRAFDDALCEELARTERTGAPMALIFVDVDRFKEFNDQFGHIAGDQALQQVASVLLAQARPYDQVARYGGEELTLILPDTGQSAGMAVAERIRLAIEDFAWPRFPITVSVGVAVATDSWTGVGLLDRADRALYQAKRTGRNCVVFLDDEEDVAPAASAMV
jgi:diguanylate cyclase (GGDEF)-like protein